MVVHNLLPVPFKALFQLCIGINPGGRKPPDLGIGGRGFSMNYYYIL